MRHADINKMIKKLNVPASKELDNKIQSSLSNALPEQKITTSAAMHILWSKIMKSTITKLAAAAVIIIAVAMGITLLETTTTTAWAIEQSIEVLKKFNGIYILGTMLDEQGKEVSSEIWAKANDEQTASDRLRLESANGQIMVVLKNVCHRYDPQTNTVNVIEGQGSALSPWPGGQFLATMKNLAIDWQESYGTDPATGRQRVFVSCSHPIGGGDKPRSWWFEFDVESKLLVSMKQWSNMKREGNPSYYAKSISYFEDLPDEKFHFETPQGAKVVNGLPERMNKLQDPNAGMPTGNMTEDEATKEIARRYWQAVVDKDWDTVALLRPIANTESWKQKYNRNFEEIIEIGQPYQDEGCKLGKIVTCTIKVENSEPVKINMVVLFRDINEQRSCIIAGTWGSE